MLRSLEEEQQIEALRLQADGEALDAIAAIKYRNQTYANPRKKKVPVRVYAVGDKVFFYTSEYGELQKGTITHVDEFTNVYQVTSVKREVFEDVWRLKPREVIDYSKVVVRDEIKKMSIRKLVKENSSCRGQLSYASYEGTIAYSYWEKYYTEIKAELSTRGHFKRRSEIRTDKKQEKIQKLKDRVAWQKRNGKHNTKEQRHLKKILK
jgi:hypothetical protein